MLNRFVPPFPSPWHWLWLPLLFSCPQPSKEKIKLVESRIGIVPSDNLRSRWGMHSRDKGLLFWLSGIFSCSSGMCFFKAPLVRGFLTNEWWLKLSARSTSVTLEIVLLNKEHSGLLSSYPSPIALPFKKIMGFLSLKGLLLFLTYRPWLYLRKLA